MTLKTLIADNEELLNSAERVRGVLSDIYPGDKTKVHIMMTAYQADVVTFIRSHPHLDQLAVDTFITHMVERFAMMREYAADALDEWAAALLSDEELKAYNAIQRRVITRDFSYEGQTENGVPHGKGKGTYSDGRVYVGQWVNGHKHGHGLCTWADGTSYEGSFQNDLRHGQGTQTEADGEKYVGSWADDRKHGKGSCTWPNGAKYEGSYANNQRNGKGTQHDTHGNIYKGDWKDDKRHGRGELIWKSGDVYKGEFANGQRHGAGKQFFADGAVYQGTWVKGKREGEGLWISPEKEKFKCVWKDDVCISKEACAQQTKSVKKAAGAPKKTTAAPKKRSGRSFAGICVTGVLTITIVASCLAYVYCIWGAELSEGRLSVLFDFTDAVKFSTLYKRLCRICSFAGSRVDSLFTGFFSEHIGGVIEDIKNLFM